MLNGLSSLAISAWKSLYLGIPVPAGMRRPINTFSLRPRSSSFLPSSAACVRTLVVSWKDAADRNDSVVSDALVIPSNKALALAGCRPSAIRRSFSPRNSAFYEDRVTRRRNLNFLQHLANDNFNVLIINFHTLKAINFLNFISNIASNRFFT
jgi:hypothetical protein